MNLFTFIILVAPLFSFSLAKLLPLDVKKPVLGFNTYNDIACSPNASYVTQRISQLQKLGFIHAGYNLFHLDCGWAAFNRTSDGSLTWDPQRFPDGILPLSREANTAGLHWGMYTDTGLYMCDTSGFNDVQRAGSFGHEYNDTLLFKHWNAEYVKIDNCWLSADSQGNHDPRTDYPERYGKFWKAFQKVGIPALAVCQWAVPQIGPHGFEGPAEWTSGLSTSYRVADDVYHSWHTVVRVWNEALHTIYHKYNGPGHFVDMDILEVGNGDLTLAEQQTHFAIWAGFKSTLLASTNLDNPSKETLQILLNKDLIAVNQDSLGVPAKLVQRFTGDHDVYSGPLAHGDVFVLLVNLSDSPNNITVNFTQVGVATAQAKNLYTGEQVGAVKSYSASVDAHGSIALRLSSVKKQTMKPPVLRYYEAESGEFVGGASAGPCTSCSGGKLAGGICDQATVKLTGIEASSAEMDVRFDYINTEFSVNDDGVNFRGATVWVNAGPPQTVEFPFSGYTNDTGLWKDYLVRLNGFNVGGSNSIKIGAATSVTHCAPNVDRIGVI